METKKNIANKGKKVSPGAKTKEKVSSETFVDTLEFEVPYNKELQNEPLYTKMGAIPEKKGCTFTIWAPHADAVFLKYKSKSEAIKIIELQKTTIMGYGENCYTTFVDKLREGTLYRYIIEYNNETVERIDAWGQSVYYPHWTPSTPDDSDVWSVVVSREFDWKNTYPIINWNEMVIYQLHIGTFFSQNPGIPAKISSITSIINHFKNLGINVIQLLPFTEFGSKLSLGYNTMLPYAIEKDYGTPEEFKDFIQTCHDNGIMVFLDVIFNHIDIAIDSPDPKPYSLSVYDGWETTDYPNGVFFYPNKYISTPWGAPRPNYSLSGVRHYFVDNIRMWIDEYKIDGFRFDSTKCMRKTSNDGSRDCNSTDIIVNGRNHAWELMQTINNMIVEAYPHVFSIAEDLDNNSWITRKTSSGGGGFDSQWDSDIKNKLTDVLTKPYDHMINLNGLADAITNPMSGEAMQRVVYIETHNTTRDKRLAQIIEPDNAEGWFARKKTMLGLGIILTSPGIPMIFQGQEFLAWQPWNDNTPIDWKQQKKYPKYFKFVSDLIRLRTNEQGHTSGLCGSYVQVIQCNNESKVLVYRRWSKTDNSDNVIVIANFSNTTYHNYTIGFPQFGKWKVRMNSDLNIFSDKKDFGNVNSYDASASPGNWDNQPFCGEIAIGPYSLIILSQ